MAGRAFYWISVALSAVFLIGPLVAVIPLAFNESSFVSYPISGLTLKWFRQVFTQEVWITSFANSVKIASAVAILSTALGTAAAVGLSAFPKLLRTIVSSLVVAPLLVPTVVLAVGFYFLFADMKLVGSSVSIVLGHTLLGIPLVFVPVAATLQAIRPELALAARGLGASRAWAFCTITFPLALRGILTGAIFAFVTSFDEVVISLFLAGPETKTLPIALFGGLRDKLEPTTIAVAIVLTALAATFLLLSAWVGTVSRKTSPESTRSSYR